MKHLKMVCDPAQKSIEEALIESERSKAVLLSNLPGVAYRCNNDENWTMTFLSEGCLELTGYRPEELINDSGISYYDLILPEQREATFKKWEQDVAAEAKSNDEYIITTKSGEKKWVWEQSIPIQDKHGAFTESEGFILDITKIKEAEKSIKESEDRFRTIFEKSPLGIGIFDTDTGEAYQLNRKFGEILGRSSMELLMAQWQSYSHPDEIEENTAKLNQLKRKEISGFSMNKKYIKLDGSIIWANMVVANFESDAKNHKHLCMIEDITQSKKKEQEIVFLSYHDILTGLYNRTFFEEEQKRRNLSRAVPMSLIMCDVNGLKMINDSFGHSEGDQLLKQVAIMLADSCRGEDFAARIGGDEFVLLLDQADASCAEKICERIYEACEQYKQREDKQTLFLSVSLGFATKTNCQQSLEELMKQAEDMMYRRKYEDKKKVRKEIIDALKAEIIAKNIHSKEEMDKMMEIALGMGKVLNLSAGKLKELELLMEISDIGGLAESEPGKHPETGYRIALGIPEIKDIAEEILSHHEHWDGTGYPNGIRGEKIPFLSRIVSVIEAYNQLTKTGNPGHNKEKAIVYLEKRSGNHFDPKIVNAFVEWIR